MTDRDDMKNYRLQANVSRWLADLTRRAAHLENRSMSSYVTSLILQDLKSKGLIDETGRPNPLAQPSWQRTNS